jgi:hypothetical protein
MLFAGCAMTVSHPRALLPLENFVPLPVDFRIQVEAGFEAYGERVARALRLSPRSRRRLPAFSRPPRVCAATSFQTHVMTPKLSAAVVPTTASVSRQSDGRGAAARATHELAHLH